MYILHPDFIAIKTVHLRNYCLPVNKPKSQKGYKLFSTNNVTGNPKKKKIKNPLARRAGQVGPVFEIALVRLSETSDYLPGQVNNPSAVNRWTSEQLQPSADFRWNAFEVDTNLGH